jgi:hypothetical protein
LYTLLIPVLRRQRQVELWEFEASLVCRVSSRTARATQRNPVLKNRKEERKKGRKEERKKGREEGRKKGRKEGRKEEGGEKRRGRKEKRKQAEEAMRSKPGIPIFHSDPAISSVFVYVCVCV